MKWNRKQTVRMLLAVYLLFALTGCEEKTETTQIPDTGRVISDNTVEPQQTEREDAGIAEIKEQCREIAAFCQALFMDAETEQTEAFPYQTVLTQDAIDGIEQKLADAGYPVINSDDIYPAYLENTQEFSAFLHAIQQGEDASQEILTVSEDQSIYYFNLQYHANEMSYTGISISWDEHGKLVLSDIETVPVLDWGTTNAGDFYYQLVPLDGHWDAYSLIRLHPIDHTLYDFNASYILPIGYAGNNLFLVDWDSENNQALSLNDTFEYLYRQRTGDYFYPDGLKLYSDVYWIPAELFEDIVWSSFDLSLSSFRQKARYNEEDDTYPWQEVNVDNVSYFPTLTSDVRECRDNADGTFTLIVDVMCLDKKADPLFTHEVTIRADEKGEFQYLANKITKRSTMGMPNSKPRIPEQWHPTE